MPNVDLRGGAAALRILRQGVNDAENVLNPTIEEDDTYILPTRKYGK